LSDVATKITLAVRNPKLLGYNRTARSDGIVENPSRSSIHHKRRPTIIHRRVRDEENPGPAFMSECLEACWFYFEDIGYIDFRNSRREGIGNVAICEKATGIGVARNAGDT
jgi:hypothetical protein